jgi:hypothetical protein
MHGLDVIEFLEQHAPPQFTGTRRMAKTEFEDKIRTWEQAWKAYARSLTAFAVKRGDCVGISSIRHKLHKAHKSFWNVDHKASRRLSWREGYKK